VQGLLNGKFKVEKTDNAAEFPKILTPENPSRFSKPFLKSRFYIDNSASNSLSG
jgi:hypothetical protein